jgi:hypothetical protein
VLELEVLERSPSTLRNVDGGPLGDAGAGGLEVGDVGGGPLGELTASPVATITEV